MERTLSQDERIRRAEEIYYRRQNLRERTKRATVNVSSEPRNLKLLKRVALQIIICVLIYFIFYLVNTTNYSFSEDALGKTEELISQDLDFTGIYNNISNWINSYISSLNINKEDTNTVVNEVKAEEVENTVSGENKIIEQGEINNTNENQNIAVVAEVNEETTGQTEVKEIELSETDRIKQKYSFILPIVRNRNIRIWNKRVNF